MCLPRIPSQVALPLVGHLRGLAAASPPSSRVSCLLTAPGGLPAKMWGSSLPPWWWWWWWGECLSAGVCVMIVRRLGGQLPLEAVLRGPHIHSSGGGQGVARWTCLGVNGIGLGQEEWVNKTKQDKTKQVLAFSLTIASIFSLSLSTLLCLCSTIWPILYGLITDRVVRYCCQNYWFRNKDL